MVQQLLQTITIVTVTYMQTEMYFLCVGQVCQPTAVVREPYRGKVISL